MNLKKKKKLIAKTLKVGVGRISLDSEMRDEIKEAITRQDIRDLKKSNIIKIKAKKGKRKIKRKTRRRGGSRKKNLKKRKQNYVKLTRKLRNYVKSLRDNEKISKEIYKEIRKKIKTKMFSDLAHLREAIKEGTK